MLTYQVISSTMLLSKVAVYIAPFIHLLIAILQCVVFPDNESIQKALLGKHFQSKEALTVMNIIMFNLGAYNAIVSSITLFGIFFNLNCVIVVTLVIYIINGLTWRVRFPSRWGHTLVMILPSIIALGLPNELFDDETTPSTKIPVPIVIFCALLHFSFFIAESVLFKGSTIIQKVFMGNLAKSPAAIEVSSPYFFCQGVHNLCLAAAIVYGALAIQSAELVECCLVAYVTAAIALVFSNPKLYKGAILQGGPPLIGLYLLRS